MWGFGTIAFLIAFVLALGGTWYYKITDTKSANSAPDTETSYRGNPSTTLTRSNEGLTRMPQEILSMTELRELDLSHNKLEGALPAEIRQLKNLEVLNISDNRMTGLPAEIGQLSKLRELNAAHNNLTGIPHELGNLQNLQILDLSGNSISPQDLQVIKSHLPASTQILL